MKYKDILGTEWAVGTKVDGDTVKDEAAARLLEFCALLIHIMVGPSEDGREELDLAVNVTQAIYEGLGDPEALLTELAVAHAKELGLIIDDDDDE